jgi:thiol-disulfide isomerase/thioredoxin
MKMNAIVLRTPFNGLLLSAALAVSIFAAEPRRAKSDTSSETNAAAAKSDTPALPFLTVMLARDPAVHAELNLTSQQREALDQAIANVDLPLWQLRDASVKDGAEKLDSLLSKFRESLARILSANQVQRFDQIVFRARRVDSLLAPETIERVSITPKQVAQIRAALAKNRAPANEDEAARILAPLASSQRAQLAGLMGQPFDFAKVKRVGGTAPELRGVDYWINSEPLTLQELRGKVVVIHFWAFECINCVHNLPHYQSWHQKFSPQGLTIIGIQTPETTAEGNIDLLRQNVAERKIAYPVAFDRAAANWKAWANHTWPSVYLVDKRGQIRAWWYGELNWQGSRGEESMREKIEELLAEKFD